MKIDILTLFPEMFEGPFSESLLKKAQQKGIISINIINLRDFTSDKHKTADDKAYGGGPGMVLKPEPLFAAIKSLSKNKKTRIIFMSPSGKKLTQEKAKELSKEAHLLILCGHYEDVDQRILKNLVTDEISVGDYVLTGGELPAMVLTDCVSRLIRGVVKEEASVTNESFYDGLLDYPSYTKPEIFNKMAVPGILLSGHHKNISRWRRKEALKETFFKRPDLLGNSDLTKEDKALLEEIIKEERAL
ncbi:tRNA (guanosine(37)-N1)-methyltransferase TrmD [candidate division WOR-1 bacterium RIFOXYC2_FULL_37_10]|nr:MAG: tRNA (guanosine(37)-N1)-methyltransferase TrmD [candidate division WOR-1 bacterium RIFOXYC2_FULL_37_10]